MLRCWTKAGKMKSCCSSEPFSFSLLQAICTVCVWVLHSELAFLGITARYTSGRMIGRQQMYYVLRLLLERFWCAHPSSSRPFLDRELTKVTESWLDRLKEGPGRMYIT